MTIKLVDNIVLERTGNLVESLIVSKSLVVDPPEATEAVQLAGKVALNTTSKVITIYNESGVATETISLDNSTAINALEQKINQIETLLDTAFVAQDLLYEGEVLTSKMTKADGAESSSSVTIASSGGGEVPLPHDFKVYAGWHVDKSITFDVIMADAHKTVEDSTVNELSSQDFDIVRYDVGMWKHTYIAYPKQAYEGILLVKYGQAPAAMWENFEVSINNLTYVVLVSEYPNQELTLTINLVEG